MVTDDDRPRRLTRAQELKQQLDALPEPRFQRDLSQRSRLESQIRTAENNARYDELGPQMAAEARAAATQRGFRAANRPLSGAAIDNGAAARARLDAYDAANPSVLPTPSVTAGAGRGFVNPAPVSAPAPGAAAPRPNAGMAGDAYLPAQDARAPAFNLSGQDSAAPGREVVPGVYQHGRGQYSDNPEGMGLPENPGNPSASNITAADALAYRSADPAGFRPAQERSDSSVRSPQVLHSGNDWQTRNDLRNARVSASALRSEWDLFRDGVVDSRGRRTGAAGPSPAQAAYAAMLQQDNAARYAQPGIDARTNETNARSETARYESDNALRGRLAETQARGFDAQAARRIDERRLELDERARGFDIRAAKRLENLQTRYAEAKTDADRAKIAKEIRDLSGKGDGSLKDNFMAVGGGQEWDASAGVMRNVPQRLIDLRTGQEVTGGGQRPAAQPLPPKDKLVKGQVYDTARGPARWDGSMFVPI